MSKYSSQSKLGSKLAAVCLTSAIMAACGSAQAVDASTVYLGANYGFGFHGNSYKLTDLTSSLDVGKGEFTAGTAHTFSGVAGYRFAGGFGTEVEVGYTGRDDGFGDIKDGLKHRNFFVDVNAIYEFGFTDQFKAYAGAGIGGALLDYKFPEESIFAADTSKNVWAVHYNGRLGGRFYVMSEIALDLGYAVRGTLGRNLPLVNSTGTTVPTPSNLVDKGPKFSMLDHNIEVGIKFYLS
jgi:opacity protein-like surface antigen